MIWFKRLAIGLLAAVCLLYIALVLIAYLPYEEVPRSQLLSAEDRLVSVNGVELRYRTYGKADPGRPALVLLHGFANSLQSFRALAPRVVDRFFVVAVDMAGFGLSDKPVDFDYRNAAQGQLIADFVERLGLTPVIIGGHSLGGAVALHTALRSPRVTGLVLFNPGIITTGVPSVTQHLFFPLQRLSARQFGDRDFRERFLKTSYIDPSIVTDEVMNQVMAGSRMEGYMAGMSSLMDQYVEGAELPLLVKLEKPTLIVWGAQDRGKPAGEAGDLKRRIAGSQLVMIDGAGHYVHEEKPDEVAAALLLAAGWLASDPS